MDLAVYAKVLWRFRIIIALGILVSTAVAGLAIFQVETTGGIHLKYRDPEIWQARTTLLLSQRGFPEGRLSFGTIDETGPPVADPGRLSYLAILYSQLANGDEVQRRLQRSGGIVGVMSALPAIKPDPREGLPVIDILGSATSPNAAEAIARNGATIFRSYIAGRQRAVGIAERDRVRINVLEASPAQILVPRKKTAAVFVLLAGLTATLGLAIVLENLRPRARIAPVPTDASIESERDRAISA